MAEKSKKAANDAAKKTVNEMRDSTRKKKSFPVWIPVVALVGLGGFYVMQNMNGQSASGSSAGSLAKVEGDVDSSSLEQWSYANGYAIGTDIKNSTDQLEEANKVDPAVVAQGISDALLESEAKLSEEQIQQIYTERQQALLDENLNAGVAFLDEYKAEEGVVTEDNGVAYKVLTEGSGPTVGTDVAFVTYTGKKIDGTVFDSNAGEGGEPVPFTSSAVIPGLGSVLEQMNVGAKYEIAIPSELAYGEQGQPGVINPNETLVFEVEVTDIQDAPEAPAQAQVAPAEEAEIEEEDAEVLEEDAEEAEELEESDE